MSNTNTRTQGKWDYNDISMNKTAIEIITQSPRGQNSNGYIATIECDLYTVPGQARANALYIIEAANNYEQLKELAKEMQEALNTAKKEMLIMGNIIRSIDVDHANSEYWTMDGEYVASKEFEDIENTLEKANTLLS